MLNNITLLCDHPTCEVELETYHERGLGLYCERHLPDFIKTATDPAQFSEDHAKLLEQAQREFAALNAEGRE